MPPSPTADRTSPINGTTATSNQLVNRDVVAAKISATEIAKFEVITYGFNIELRWVTFCVSR